LPAVASSTLKPDGAGRGWSIAMAATLTEHAKTIAAAV
jgi:hypothetical protein